MNGIFVVNKPAGMTSHDVVGWMRRTFHQKKFGHTGTLDPEATGVLVVLAGEACKMLQFIEDKDKEYIATMELGKSTDTDDIWGEVTDTKEVNRDFDFQEVLDTFKGKSEQKVPARSAKKVAGKKLMDYQLKGQDVPDVYTSVEIYDIQALDDEELKFSMACSSGTYVRSVIRDFGEKTDNLAVMSSLERVKANGFTIDEANPLDNEQLVLRPMEELITCQKMEADPVEDVLNGKHIRIESDQDRLAMMHDGKLLAIYDRDHGNVFRCVRGFRYEND